MSSSCHSGCTIEANSAGELNERALEVNKQADERLFLLAGSTVGDGGKKKKQSGRENFFREQMCERVNVAREQASQQARKRTSKRSCT